MMWMRLIVVSLCLIGTLDIREIKSKNVPSLPKVKRNSFWSYSGKVELFMTRDNALKFYAATTGWLKCCQEHSVEPAVVLASKCSKGILFKKRMVPYCVCVRGVWILHRNVCDESPVVLIGRPGVENDCYTITFNISSVLFLGNATIPSETKAFVAPRTMTVFHEIPADGSWTPILDFEAPVIIVINPVAERMYEAEESNECFARREVDPLPSEEFKVHIWSTSLLSTRYRQVTKCGGSKLLAGYEEFSTHNSFYFHGSKSMPLPVEGCHHPCRMTQNQMVSGWDHFGQWNYSIPHKDYRAWVEMFKNESKYSRTRVKRRTVIGCNVIWKGTTICLNSTYWESTRRVHMTDRQKKLCYPIVNATRRSPLPKYG